MDEVEQFSHCQSDFRFTAFVIWRLLSTFQAACVTQKGSFPLDAVCSDMFVYLENRAFLRSTVRNI